MHFYIYSDYWWEDRLCIRLDQFLHVRLRTYSPNIPKCAFSNLVENLKIILIDIYTLFWIIFLQWRRKTTEGLSIYLFVLAVLGNTFYACQIFVRSINAVFVVTSLPWILGSLGMLVFDFIVSLQIILFNFYANLILDRIIKKSSLSKLLFKTELLRYSCWHYCGVC